MSSAIGYGIYVKNVGSERIKMSHQCPECGQLCFCNGDIDDCCNDFEEDVINCEHWRECQEIGNDEYDPDDDYDYTNEVKLS